LERLSIKRSCLKEGLEIKQLIQATYASSKDEVEKREIKSLVKASELLKCKNLLIWDYEDELRIEIKLLNSYLCGNGF
jgi:hypothetical protein